MHDSSPVWYFSTMVLDGTRQAMSIRSIEFSRRKYGPELLVDVGWVHDLDGFILDDEPHRLLFYDILLVTSGEGRLRIDEGIEPVEPDTLLFTSPGQVRRLHARGLDGPVLFFVGEFVEDFFADPLFLFRLHFFHRHHAQRHLRLSPARAAWLIERLEKMRSELRNLRGDSVHLLRAILYEVLITLNRWYAAEHGTGADTQASPQVFRFLKLLEMSFRSEHQVAPYAARLGVTPGHLSHLTRSHLGLSAGTLIRSRLLAEARRLLLYSDLTAREVGYKLGFEDPSYFSRFFKRGAGRSPSDYRATHRRFMMDSGHG